MFINYHSIYLSVYEIVTLKVTDHCICGYGHPDSTRCNQLRRGLVPKKRNRLLPSPEKSVFAYSPQPAEGQSIQAKQLANRSGYRSYRTFSVAFKQRTGQSVKDWIAEQESALQSNKQ